MFSFTFTYWVLQQFQEVRGVLSSLPKLCNACKQVFQSISWKIEVLWNVLICKCSKSWGKLHRGPCNAPLVKIPPFPPLLSTLGIVSLPSPVPPSLKWNWGLYTNGGIVIPPVSEPLPVHWASMKKELALWLDFTNCGMQPTCRTLLFQMEFFIPWNHTWHQRIPSKLTAVFDSNKHNSQNTPNDIRHVTSHHSSLIISLLVGPGQLSKAVVLKL